MHKVLLRRVGVVVSVVTLSMVGAVGLSSQAGAGATELNVTPTTVPAGETITVTQYCDEGWTVDVAVYQGWTEPSTTPIVSGSTTVPAGRQWTIVLTIPAGADPGSYTVAGDCEGPNGSRTFGSVELTVIPAPTTTTTTTSMPTTTTMSTTTTTTTSTSTTTTTSVASGTTTTTPTTTVAPRPIAPAATAVVAQPKYTG